MKFSKNEIELIKKAVSFLSTNVSEAEDALDVELSQDEIEELEAKLYENEID